MEVKDMLQYNINAIKALDGQIYAMLTPDEETILNFYLDQGRKYGVEVKIINKADPVKLARARSKKEAAQIMKSANSLVCVKVISDF